jgi:hypothetical protein
LKKQENGSSSRVPPSEDMTKWTRELVDSTKLKHNALSIKKSEEYDLT